MDPVTIIAALSAATRLANQLYQIMEDRRRKQELTPEEEAEWDRHKAHMMTQPHWQPSIK